MTITNIPTNIPTDSNTSVNTPVSTSIDPTRSTNSNSKTTYIKDGITYDSRFPHLRYRKQPFYTLCCKSSDNINGNDDKPHIVHLYLNKCDGYCVAPNPSTVKMSNIGGYGDGADPLAYGVCKQTGCRTWSVTDITTGYRVPVPFKFDYGNGTYDECDFDTFDKVLQALDTAFAHDDLLEQMVKAYHLACDKYAQLLERHLSVYPTETESAMRNNADHAYRCAKAEKKRQREECKSMTTNTANAASANTTSANATSAPTHTCANKVKTTNERYFIFKKVPSANGDKTVRAQPVYDGFTFEMNGTTWGAVKEKSNRHELGYHITHLPTGMSATSATKWGFPKSKQAVFEYLREHGEYIQECIDVLTRRLVGSGELESFKQDIDRQTAMDACNH